MDLKSSSYSNLETGPYWSCFLPNELTALNGLIILSCQFLAKKKYYKSRANEFLHLVSRLQNGQILWSKLSKRRLDFAQDFAQRN